MCIVLVLQITFHDAVHKTWILSNDKQCDLFFKENVYVVVYWKFLTYYNSGIFGKGINYYIFSYPLNQTKTVTEKLVQ